MDFELVEIKDIKEIDYDGTVIDLTVEDDSSYNVEGYIVHNSACSTRIVTGCGYPQLSAIKNIRESIGYDSHVTIIADGGIRFSGDIVKALAAGADTVMVGGLIAGTKETPGKILTVGHSAEKKMKVYSGSASYDAQIEHMNKDKREVTAEGVSNLIQYKGTVVDVIQNVIRGIKSGFSYCGCKNMSEMHEYGSIHESWVKNTYASMIENGPHILNKG